MNEALNDFKKAELDMEIILSEDDNVVYVKLSGFDSKDDADQYASFLHENLPLLLFETEVKH
jgi:hypothetical protein